MRSLAEYCKRLEGWESYYSSGSGKALWKEATETFLLEVMDQLVPNEQKISVLDVGCGDGRNSFIWLVQKHEIFCMDVAQSALGAIRTKCLERGISPPVLLHENLLETQLPSDRFDVVQSFDVIEHISDASAAIAKLCSLACPGGYIVFNYLTKNDCSYGEGEKVDEGTFIYKNTLFKFMSETEIIKILPENVEIIRSETKRWDDPPHGEYRPYPHTHEAAFFLLKKRY